MAFRARRPDRLLKELVLSTGAVVGVLCILMAIGSAFFDLRPLIFRSGSMSPTIATGALAIAHNVPSMDLEVGDIVMVKTDDGTRVTHRIVKVTQRTDGATLALKGDANKVPDAQVYDVAQADRVWFAIPKAGYVVSWLAGPIGLFLLGLYAAFLMFVLFVRPGRDDEGSPNGLRRPSIRPTGRRRADGVSRRIGLRISSFLGLVALTATAIIATSGPTWAAGWNDPTGPATVSGTTFSTHTVLPPDSSSCSASSPTATISWPEKDSLYNYEIVLKRSDNSIVSTKQVTGASVSQGYTALGDFNFGALALGAYDFTVEIRSYLAASSTWRGSSVLVAAKKIRVTVILVLFVPVLGTVSCV